jgi:hypothetical protein
VVRSDLPVPRMILPMVTVGEQATFIEASTVILTIASFPSCSSTGGNLLLNSSQGILHGEVFKIEISGIRVGDLSASG